jgi:hypothetical protein
MINTDKGNLFTKSFIFIFFILSAVLFYNMNALDLSTFFHDDSFFYMKIARNYGEGNGNTFDNIHKTDGFHNLYMLWLSLISYFFPIKGDMGQVVVGIFDMLLFTIGLIIIDSTLKRIQWNVIKRILIISILIFSFAFKDFGMECRLMFVAFALFLYQLTSPKRNPIALVITASLCVLVRIDYLILPFLVIAYVLAEDVFVYKKGASSFKNVAFVFIPILFALTSMCIHKVLFGSFTSVSSNLKGSFVFFPTKFYPSHSAYWWKKYMILGVAALNICLFIFYRKRIREFKMILIPIFTISYIVITSILLRGGFHIWYLNIHQTVNVLVCGFLLVSIFYKPIKLYNALISIVAAFIFIVFIYSTYNRTVLKRPSMSVVNYSKMLTKIVNEDERIYQVDESGRVGYFSERKLINGDGLVNDWEYRDYLLSNRLSEYFVKENIKYISHDEYLGGDKLTIIVPKWTNPNAYIVITAPKPFYQMGRFALFLVEENQIEFVYD